MLPQKSTTVYRMSAAEPMYWEDFVVGETAELGKHTFGAEEIVEFARKYDPNLSTSTRRPPPGASSAG
jgi:acyl dehydratase